MIKIGEVSKVRSALEAYQKARHEFLLMDDPTSGVLHVVVSGRYQGPEFTEAARPAIVEIYRKAALEKWNDLVELGVDVELDEELK